MSDGQTMRGESNHAPGSSNGTSSNMGSYDSNIPRQFPAENPQEVMSTSEEPPASMLVTPDMLYKLSKKIAQLTKVIYSLNTKNDDLEMDLEHLRSTYEEKLKLAQQQLQLATTNLQQQLQQDTLSESGVDLANGLGGSTPENGTRRRRSKTPEMDSETKKELKRTRQCLKQTEAKVKAMEEEILEKKQEMDRLHKEAAARQTTPNPVLNGDNPKIAQLEQKLSTLEHQLKLTNREKQEAKMRLDRLDIQKENLRLERDMLKKDLNEVNAEKSGLQLQLSAARIQLNYNREMGFTSNEDKVDSSNPVKPVPENDDFADELIAKIEVLTQEKSDLAKELENSRSIQENLRKELEHMKKNPVVAAVEAIPDPDFHKNCQVEKNQLGYKIAQLESSLKDMSDSHEQQMATIRDDKDRALEESSNKHEAEISHLRSVFERETIAKEREMFATTERLSAELNEKAAEKVRECEEMEQRLANVQKELEESGERERAKESELSAATTALSALEESESRIRLELTEIRDREQMFKQEMGQNVEKLCTLEEKCKTIEKERDDLKRKCKEIEAKMDVMTRAVVKDTDEKVRQLERALEEALVEREEILEACEREIGHEKTIAIETEQKMMDDFEWKLREIEAEYRGKIREAEESARISQEEYARKKDEELTRMSISLRREMEEKLRLERTSLKTALDAQHATDREKAIEVVRAESRIELRILQSSWDEEKNRLDREIRSLRRKIEELEKEATSRRAEIEQRVQEERYKSETALDRLRRELELVRQQSEQKIESLNREHAVQIEELESRLSTANDNRMSSMFQMREEVETEFTERMEQLRNMYMTEIESQAEKMEEEKAKANRTEISLRQMLAERQAEVDELNSYYSQQGEDYEAKINELLTRLQEQTTLAVKLQAEIDEYEWYEEDEEGGGGGGGSAGGGAGVEEEEERRTQTPRRPSSRPSSTRPLEQHRIPETESLRHETTNLRHGNSSVASLASTASYATATGQADGGHLTATTPDSLQSFASNSSSPSQPEPPPRASASAASRRSWNPDPEASPQPQHTVIQNPDLNLAALCTTTTDTPVVADRPTGDGLSTQPQPQDPGSGQPFQPTVFDHPILENANTVQQIVDSDNETLDCNPADSTPPLPMCDHAVTKIDFETDKNNLFQSETENESVSEKCVKMKSEIDCQRILNLDSNTDPINVVQSETISTSVKETSISNDEHEGKEKIKNSSELSDILEEICPNSSSLDCFDIKTPFGKSFEGLEITSNEANNKTEEKEENILIVESCQLQTRDPLEMKSSSGNMEKLEGQDGFQNKIFKSNEEQLVFDLLKSKKKPNNDLKEASKAIIMNNEESLPTDVKLTPESNLDPDDESRNQLEVKFIDEDDNDDVKNLRESNPTIEVESAESNDDVSDQLIPSAKSSSKSSLGAFFHQKLFRSPSASSTSAATCSSSGHSSPETKCVLEHRNKARANHNNNNNNNNNSKSNNNVEFKDRANNRNTFPFEANGVQAASLLDACLTLINIIIFPTH